MQFMFDLRSAKKLARSLEKALEQKGIALQHGQALDILSSMQGYADWNALAARLHPGTLRTELDEFERTHMRESRGQRYGREGELKAAHNGFALRFPLDSEGCEYVRTVDPFGREIAYWDHEEWQRDPRIVMGAILGSVVRSQESLSASETVSAEVTVRSPLTVYCKTHPRTDAWVDVPLWAKIVITQERLDALLRMRDIVIQSGLVSVTQYDGPDLWGKENDPENPIRMECDEVSVTSTFFCYSAYLKHSDLAVETATIDFDPLLEAITGPSDAKAVAYERHGDVLIWGDYDEFFLDMLREDGEDLSGWPVGESTTA